MSVFGWQRFFGVANEKSAAKDTYRRVTLKTFRRFWGEKSWAGGISFCAHKKTDSPVSGNPLF